MDAGAIAVAEKLLGTLTIALAAGAAGFVIAQRLRVPDVAIFLLVGILLGPQMLGWVDVPAASAVNQLILVFGASFILFDGGASLRLAVLKRVWITIVVIATVGLLITAFVTAAAAAPLFGVPFIVALLLAATLASTDPATLVPIFKQVKIRERVEQTVISESAFNDAMGAILAFTVLGLAQGTQALSVPHVAIAFVREAGLGLLVGAGTGYAAGFVLGHPRHDWLASAPALVVAIGVAATYLLAGAIGGSGFMAVFVFGILLGNRDVFGFAMEPAEEHGMHHFIQTAALFLRLLIFILLGSQVDFALVGRYLLPGIALMAVFMLVARPLTVFACALPDRRARWSRNEMLFMCWTRETGVIPAALAGMLAGMNAPGAEMITSVTFIAVLATILIQAPTTRWLAARLGLLEPSSP